LTCKLDAVRLRALETGACAPAAQSARRAREVLRGGAELLTCRYELEPPRIGWRAPERPARIRA
jgi:hypothetical protein